MIEIVRVVACHPEANAVDVVVLRTGARVPGVQVLADMAGANHGSGGLVRPAEQDTASPYSAPPDDATAILGAMAYAGGLPLLVGFLHPQVSQMLFADRNRFTWRHPSDLYLTATDDGSIELAHPSGTFFRISEAPAHENLTGQDHDQRWAIKRNTGRAPHVRLEVAAAGGVHTTLDIAPGGNISLHCDGNLAVDVGGNATVQVAGDASVAVDGHLGTQAASWTHDGPTIINGTVAINGGSLTHNGTDVGDTHVHPGVSRGLSSTDPPA